MKASFVEKPFDHQKPKPSPLTSNGGSFNNPTRRCAMCNQFKSMLAPISGGKSKMRNGKWYCHECAESV